MKNILLISVVVLLFAACPNHVQQEEATLTLHFGAIEARAVYPPDAATLVKLEHTITLVGPVDTITRTFEPGVTSANIAIVTGTWKITVVAHLLKDSEKILYAAGSKTVAITAGANSVTIKMYGDESSEGLAFEVIADGPNAGTARVRANGWLEGDIIIPGYYKDGANFLPVTEIGSESDDWGSGAFTSCYDITGITIPSSVTSIGAYAFQWCDRLKTITFASDNQLKSIGGYAFYYCRSLTAITIPEGVTVINDNAFYSCENLTAITIPASITDLRYGAFSYCYKLANVTFTAGSQLKSILSNAFSYCTSLTAITIPAGVKNNINDPNNNGILGNPFIGCTKLAAITVEASNPDYSSAGGILYNKNKTELLSYPTVPENFTIPVGVTTIGNGAFHQCTALTSVTIPGSVTNIGQMAFSYCENLTSVNLNTGLEHINDNAFSNCSKLTGISLPNGLISIIGSAFAYTDLRTIAIPESVNNLVGNPFVGCKNLTAITIEGTASIYTAVGGALYNENEMGYDNDGNPVTHHALISYPAAIGNVTSLPLTLTKIGMAAFFTTTITDITLPATVTIIDNHAFDGCENLVSINLPTGLKTIGFSAFNYCRTLTGNITLPTGLETIGSTAFANTAINTFTIPATVSSVGGGAFSGWTSSQTINIQGKANQEAANNAWIASEDKATDEYGNIYIYNWQSYCEATINYQG